MCALCRYDEMYELFMSCTNGTTGVTAEFSFTNSVANFFDENGFLCDNLFDEEVIKLHASLTSDKKIL